MILPSFELKIDFFEISYGLGYVYATISNKEFCLNTVSTQVYKAATLCEEQNARLPLPTSTFEATEIIAAMSSAAINVKEHQIRVV